MLFIGSCSTLFFLFMSEPTHLCSNGSSSMIDLIAMSSPSLFQSYKTIPPLYNSDHLGLSYNLSENTQVNLKVILKG